MRPKKNANNSAHLETDKYTNLQTYAAYTSIYPATPKLGLGLDRPDYVSAKTLRVSQDITCQPRHYVSAKTWLTWQNEHLLGR
jgi:hypothetical protein